MDNFLSIIPLNHPIFVVAIIIVGILLIRTIFSTAVKLTIMAAIGGFIMVVFFGYSPHDVVNKGKQIATYTTSYTESTIKPAIYHGLKNAHVEKGPKGTVAFVGDNFYIGETPQGTFVFHVKSLNLSINQDELAKYLSKDEMEKLLQTLQEKKQTIDL